MYSLHIIKQYISAIVLWKGEAMLAAENKSVANSIVQVRINAERRKWIAFRWMKCRNPTNAFMMRQQTGGMRWIDMCCSAARQANRSHQRELLDDQSFPIAYYSQRHPYWLCSSTACVVESYLQLICLQKRPPESSSRRKSGNLIDDVLNLPH